MLEAAGLRQKVVHALQVEASQVVQDLAEEISGFLVCLEAMHDAAQEGDGPVDFLQSSSGGMSGRALSVREAKERLPDANGSWKPAFAEEDPKAK